MNCFFLSLVSILFLTSCAHVRVDAPDSDYQNVKNGMTEAQVITLLGEPDQRKSFGQEEILSWEGVRVAFSKNAVVNKYETDESNFYNFTVDAQRFSDPKNKTVVILPAKKVPAECEKAYQEVKRLITTVLQNNGYGVSESLASVSTAVLLDVKVDELKTKATPWYSRNFIITAMNYPKFLKNKNAKPYWKTVITSEGETADLISVVPYLAIASEDFIAKTTAGNAKTFVFQNDPRVKSLVGRLPSSVHP